MTQKLCFIGGGNMATSLIGGMIANAYPASYISACDINEPQLSLLEQKFGIQTATDCADLAVNAEIIILAIKPQVMQTVCEQLAKLALRPGCMFISIAAGVRERDMQRWLGGNRAIVRCMPNTPALMQLGATALYANQEVSSQQKLSAQKILVAVGITVWVKQESELDAVTAISGSGPAYFFYFIELLQKAGVNLGLDPKTAELLAKQTALGAATMALSGDVEKLREQVTSKKGTTEQAILSFQADNLAGLVDNATQAAHDRSVELGDQLANL